MKILLIFVGAFIIYLVIEFIYSKYWLRGLSAKVSFLTERVYAGEVASLREEIINKKWLPLPLVNLKFQIDKKLVFDENDANISVTDKAYRNEVFSILFFQKITRTIPVVCKSRGYYDISKIELISSGYFMRQILVFPIPIKEELIVYPNQVDIGKLNISYQKIMGNVITRRNLFEDNFVLRGIREYEPHDPQKMINWKASARTGDWKVNMYDYTTSREVCMLLNLDEHGGLYGEDMLEESISIVSSLSKHLIESGVSVEVISNARDIITNEMVRVLAGSGNSHAETIDLALARIDLKKEKEDSIDLLDMATRKSYSNPIYVLVSCDKNIKLQERYQEVCAENKGSMWIMPHYESSDWEPENCTLAELISWEMLRRKI